MITFTIPGDPVGKGRPRHVRLKDGRHMTHTPQTTIDFENRVRFAAEQAGVTPLEGPVELKVLFFFGLPKSRERKREPRPRSWRAKAPDLDNLFKAVADGLNGIGYADDRQVVSALMRKLEAAQGEPARTVVRLRGLGPLLAVDAHPERKEQAR